MKNEQKNVPKLRFQGFTGEWEQCKLGESFDFLQNNTLSRADLSNDKGVAKNVHYGDVLIKFGEYLDASAESLPFIPSRQVVEKYKDSLLRDGDVIMADTAEDETVGKCTEIAEVQGFPTISGLHTIPMRPKQRFAAGYLGYYMNSKAYHDQLLPLMQGVKVTSVSKSAIRDTIISYPSDAAEQRVIGRSLIGLDTLITLQQRKLAQIKEYKKGMLQKMFPKKGETVPELRFPGSTDDWEQRKLGEMVQFSKGTGYSKGDLRESGTPIILYGRLYTKYETVISEVDTFTDAKANSVYSQGGEVIVPASGETAEDISIASVVEKPGILIGGDLNIITPSANLDSAFLALTISNGKPHEDMARVAQGKSVVHLHNSDLEKIDLFFPSHEEQIQISAFFKTLDTIITLHQRKLNAMKEYKKGLLQQMFV